MNQISSTTLRPHAVKRYGWVPDLPDARDHRFRPTMMVAHLPPSVDLRPGCPPVYDQGDLGSCTGNAIAAALQFDRKKQDLGSDLVPSRLFIYYNERVIEHTVAQDAGAMIRDGIKVVAKLGAPPETEWPYDVAKFATRPPPGAFVDALAGRALTYERIARSATAMRACLASGFPFVFGFSVYESFEADAVARTGEVPLPKKTEQLLGGHAVLAVGYDDATKRFLVRNSWGSGWGDGGYFTMSYAYLTSADLADDFWAIRLVASPKVSA